MKLKTATLLVLCTQAMGLFITICNRALILLGGYSRFSGIENIINLASHITLVIFFYILYKNQKRDVKGE